MGHSPIPFPQKNRERKADYQTFIYAIIEKIKQEYIYVYITDIETSSSPYPCMHTNKISMMFSIKFARTENCERNLILTTNLRKRKKEKSKVLSKKMNKGKIHFHF